MHLVLPLVICHTTQFTGGNVWTGVRSIQRNGFKNVDVVKSAGYIFFVSVKDEVFSRVD